ncbi:MAG: hypothetical protein B7Z45_05145 [Azorhizobium sp. 12-66-6]|nr:MAG: hypothetical protein B7Z45_05145 [Azorhizobium sp. 12-66-6]
MDAYPGREWQATVTSLAPATGAEFSVLPAQNATGNVCVFDDNGIRSSVGASLIWQSPFGPLRFDYAWVLSQQAYDKDQAFRFSGGTKF